jgi:hypothetical protein
MSNPAETQKNQINDKPTPSSTPGIYVWTKIVISGSEVSPNPISIRKIVIRSLKAVGTDRHEHTFNRTSPADDQQRTETHIPKTLGSGSKQEKFYDSYDVESIMLPVQWTDVARLDRRTRRKKMARRSGTDFWRVYVLSALQQRRGRQRTFGERLDSPGSGTR